MLVPVGAQLSSMMPVVPLMPLIQISHTTTAPRQHQKLNTTRHDIHKTSAKDKRQ